MWMCEEKIKATVRQREEWTFNEQREVKSVFPCREHVVTY